MITITRISLTKCYLSPEACTPYLQMWLRTSISWPVMGAAQRARLARIRATLILSAPSSVTDWSGADVGQVLGVTDSSWALGCCLASQNGPVLKIMNHRI